MVQPDALPVPLLPGTVPEKPDGHATATIVLVKYGDDTDAVTAPEYPGFTVHPELPPVPVLPGTEPTELTGHETAAMVLV